MLYLTDIGNTNSGEFGILLSGEVYITVMEVVLHEKQFYLKNQQLLLLLECQIVNITFLTVCFTFYQSNSIFNNDVIKS